MISAGDFRNGITIELDNNIFQIIEFQHVKPGKGAAFVRTKLKNIKNGGIVERTFRPTEKCPQARIDRADMQYLYSDGDLFHFMDVESYEQIALDAEAIGDALKFVKENEMVKMCSHNGSVFAVEPPLFVELMMFHETEVVTIGSSLFDILDFSVEIGLNSVDIGKLSPIHSIVHQAPPVSLQFKILDGIDLSKISNPLLTNPHAFVVPYGEHWTIRVDSNVCFVTSGTQSTAIAIRAAILRHISLEYLKDGKQKTTENLFNEKFQILQNAGFELSELLEHEPLPTSELSQKVTQLHSLADQWIQSILNFS